MAFIKFGKPEIIGTEDCGLSTILFYVVKLLERHNFFINLEEVEEE